MTDKQYTFRPEKVDQYFDYESKEVKVLDGGSFSYEYNNATLKKNWSLSDAQYTFKKKQSFITVGFSSMYPLGVVCWRSSHHGIMVLTVDSDLDYGPFYKIE